MLQPPSAPYALTPPAFRFPALAALAGGLPVGAGREAALAVLLVARLATGALPQAGLSRTLRARRATAARHWIGATCPEARVRGACLALADATAGDEPEAVAGALSGVVDAAASHLDQLARRELTSLARTFTDQVCRVRPAPVSSASAPA